MRVQLFLCLLGVLVWSSSISPTETIPEYVAKYGITAETHEATTEDGYVLTLFRLPRPGGQVVYLNHGILASAWCWIVNNYDNSIGFKLWALGFDVWMGNNRGNTYSRKHVKYPINSTAFWNFTFADMARFDVPTHIGYVLNQTKAEKLTYMGWSQGVTQILIAGTLEENQWLKERLNLVIALSPVSYLKHSQSVLLSLLSVSRIADAIYAAYPYDFLDFGSTLDGIIQLICKLTFGKVCQFSVDLVCGHSPYDTAEGITNLTAHFPAGTSVKDMKHFAQYIKFDEFTDFDYGCIAPVLGKCANIDHYGTRSPPKFDLTNFNLPIALFAGSMDVLVEPRDYNKLQAELPNESVVFSKTYGNFSHLTWLVGEERSWSWFNDVMKLLHQYGGN